jgi:hypothetical protein
LTIGGEAGAWRRAITAPNPSPTIGGEAGVGGHENLNGGGQEPERWRPRKLNGRGQEICFV